MRKSVKMHIIWANNGIKLAKHKNILLVTSTTDSFMHRWFMNCWSRRRPIGSTTMRWPVSSSWIKISWRRKTLGRCLQLVSVSRMRARWLRRWTATSWLVWCKGTTQRWRIRWETRSHSATSGLMMWGICEGFKPSLTSRNPFYKGVSEENVRDCTYPFCRRFRWQRRTSPEFKGDLLFQS